MYKDITMATITPFKSPKKDLKKIFIAPISSKEEYIKSVLPMKLTESNVRYTPVGDFHFRVVFFKPVISGESLIPEYKLCRTYFVQVKKDAKNEWIHNIVDSKIFL